MKQSSSSHVLSFDSSGSIGSLICEISLVALDKCLLQSNATTSQSVWLLPIFSER